MQVNTNVHKIEKLKYLNYQPAPGTEVGPGELNEQHIVSILENPPSDMVAGRSSGVDLKTTDECVAPTQLKAESCVQSGMATDSGP